MTKAARGHITQRGKDPKKWTIVINLGRNPMTGKPRQQWVSFRGTQKEAQKKLTELLGKVDAGGYMKPSTDTVAEFMRDWLTDFSDSNVRPRTSEGYRTIIERRIIPHLGKIALSQLEPQHVNAFYKTLLKSGRVDGKGGLSARTVHHTHSVLRNALNHAVKWEKVGRNVAMAATPPRPKSKEIVTLEVDRIEDLLNLYEGTPYWPIVLTALHTGMRRSEILGLRWRDIDLDLGTISVRQVMHRLGTGEFIFDRPKTAKSRRLIPLGATIILALKQHRIEEMAKAQLIGWSSSDESQVFTRLDGSSMLPDTLSHQFIKRARAAGFDGLTFHALRHSHATWMLQQKIHPKIVQERLGHASISTTLDVYSHVVPGLQQAAAVQFDTWVQKASTKTEPVLAH